jgi:predicted dehydrogenase
MGMNQHLVRSIVAIRREGGVVLSNGDRAMPDPILIGRNAEKIEALARAHDIARWSTDLDAALARRTTPCSSTPARRRCARRCSRRRSAPASTSTARSRSPPT